jgi:4-hydroxy-tetrahydrodipicolinate synthase
MTEEEHLDVIRYCIKVVNKRIPVIAGTGSNCTKTAIYLTKEAEEAGADAALVVTPYYNKATQKGLKQHFEAVAKAVKRSRLGLPSSYKTHGSSCSRQWI